MRIFLNVLTVEVSITLERIVGVGTLLTITGFKRAMILRQLPYGPGGSERKRVLLHVITVVRKATFADSALSLKLRLPKITPRKALLALLRI